MFELANPNPQQENFDLEKEKPKNYEIIGVDENTPPIEITLSNQPHLLEFFNCVHSVPCIELV